MIFAYNANKKVLTGWRCWVLNDIYETYQEKGDLDEEEQVDGGPQHGHCSFLLKLHLSTDLKKNLQSSSAALRSAGEVVGGLQLVEKRSAATWSPTILQEFSLPVSRSSFCTKPFRRILALDDFCDGKVYRLAVKKAWSSHDDLWKKLSA